MTRPDRDDAPEHRPGGMPPGEFRRWGHLFVDWAADYLDGIEREPVLSMAEPGDVRARLPVDPPERGEDMDELLQDLQDVVMPGITHWNHPAFFAYFAVSGSGPGILGELAAAALNVNAMVWASSPAATELEEATTDWLGRFVGLPGEFQGVIHDTASTSTFLALIAARERGLPESCEDGLAAAPRGRVYTTGEAHSSVLKAAHAAGLGRRGVVRVDVTRAGGAMDPEALACAIALDEERDLRPLAVVATVGTTSTNAVDPIQAVAAVAERKGTWLHVDAAYAGPAASLPEKRGHFRGWERADSIVINPHKWLATPVDCSVLYVRDPNTLRAALSLVPAYLQTDRDCGTDLMDLSLALGRRFRALKLWFVMRYFGEDGLRAMIARHIRLARQFSRWVDASGEWERWRPSPFSLVVFRYAPAGMTDGEREGANRDILARVNRSGTAFLSHTEVAGELWIRLAIGNIHTDERHVRAAWKELERAANAASGLDGSG